MLTVRGEYLDKYQQNPGYLTQSQYEENWRQAGETGSYKDEQIASASVTYERSISEMSEVKIAYSIRHHDEEGHPTYRTGADISVEELINQNLVATYQHDLDFYRSRIIAGVDLQHSSIDDLGYNGRTISTGVDTSWDITAQVTSPFVQFEISPEERLRLTVATRYDRINYDADDRVGTGDKDLTFTNLTSKAGATLQITPDTNFWIGYGEGFVVPGTSRLFTSTSVTANPDLEPEEATNYEVGVRSKLFGKRLSCEVAAYHTTIKKMIVDGNANMYVNAGKMRFKGLESAVAFKPVDYLRFDLAHTYAVNQIIDFTDNGTDYSGNDLSISPKHHLNARVTWSPIKNFDAELEWDHISKYYTHYDNDSDPEGQEKRPDLVNLRLNYKKGPWSFWAHGLNIFNEKHATYVAYSPASGWTAAKRNISPGNALTVYTGLSYAF